MVLQGPTMSSEQLRRGSSRLAITLLRRKRPFLCRARAKLLYNYPRRVLERGRGRGEGMRREGEERVEVGASHAPSSSSSSDLCPPQGRGRRSMILRYYGVSTRPFFITSTRKFPAWYLCMRNISRTHGYNDVPAAAAAAAAAVAVPAAGRCI